MAPFMILGRSAGIALRLPALRLQSEKEKCIHCKQCSAQGIRIRQAREFSPLPLLYRAAKV